jgi:hypothetical protein
MAVAARHEELKPFEAGGRDERAGHHEDAVLRIADPEQKAEPEKGCEALDIDRRRRHRTQLDRRQRDDGDGGEENPGGGPDHQAGIHRKPSVRSQHGPIHNEGRLKRLAQRECEGRGGFRPKAETSAQAG